MERVLVAVVDEGLLLRPGGVAFVVCGCGLAVGRVRWVRLCAVEVQRGGAQHAEVCYVTSEEQHS